MELKVLITHAKDADEPWLDQLQMDITHAALKEAEGTDVDSISVILAREDFKQNATDGWDTWIVDTVDRYDAFVVPTRKFGKGTGRLLEAAIQKNKQVFWWNEGYFTPINYVKELDDEDWKHGWQLGIV